MKSPGKRILFIAAVIVVTAATFWSGSRYPSLDEKASMGGSAMLEDPLSFEASIQIQPSDGYLERVIYTTVNWVETNLLGMAFGLTIGACLLTLIGMVRARGHHNGFVNTLLGVVIGALVVKERVPGALVGGLIGILVGLFGSGIFLMIYRAVRHMRGKHD